PGGATCSTSTLGGFCDPEPNQCSECNFGADRECGLGRMTCFRTASRSGRFCAAGTPNPGGACANEEDCGGHTGTTSSCTTVGFLPSTMTLDNLYFAIDDYTASGSQRLCVPAAEQAPGQLLEPSIDPVTTLNALKVRPATATSTTMRLR